MIYDKTAMNNGVIFLRAYNILDDKMQQAVKELIQGNNGVDGKAMLDASLFVTVVVNCSFACELFIKSMLPKGTKGHKLDELFALLDSDIQERIRNLTICEMKRENSVYCSADFQRDLYDNSNKFAEWRYFHEKNTCSANLQFVSSFVKAVFEIIKEENND